MNEEFPIEWMDAKEMVAHPQNFRRHPQSQVTQIRKSLDKFGWLQNVIWNRRSGYILNGHARIELAAKAGQKVPVRVVDVNPLVEKQILLALDKTGEGATFDEETLVSLINQVVEEVDELPIGWTATELEKLITSVEGNEDEEEPEEEDELPTLSEDAPVNVPLASIRMVQLFLTQENIDQWRMMIQTLSDAYDLHTVTDVVFKAVQTAYKADAKDADDSVVQSTA